MRLFLIGLPGTGKSFWAAKLAEKHQLAYTDLDQYIEERSGHSIKEIFEEKGEQAFRQIESESLETITTEQPNIIIACGGGTPCFGNNMELMNTSGTTVFLNAPLERITENLLSSKELEKRPLFKNLSKPEEVGIYLKDLLNKRIKCYKKARYEIIPGDFENTLQELGRIINS